MGVSELQFKFRRKAAPTEKVSRESGKENQACTYVHTPAPCAPCKVTRKAQPHPVRGSWANLTFTQLA